MMYLLKRDDGAFVADMRKSPTGSSYTQDMRKARVYPSRAAAEADRCPGNERITTVECEMKP